MSDIAHFIGGSRRGAFGAALVVLLLAVAAISASSQTSASSPIAPSFSDKYLEVSAIPLWDGKAPGALGDHASDIPMLSVFRPRTGSANGLAVIIAPGGGYVNLAANHEGRQVADWFAARGVTAFVLRYRVGPRYFYPVPLMDARRAIRLVRFRARELNISPDRIGMMGFSAGGHLTAAAGTLYDAGKPDATDPVERLSSRPDFLILGYPWLDAMEPTKNGSIEYCEALGGEQQKCNGFGERYSPLRIVNAKTPPTFIYHTVDDSRVPVETSVSFFSALHKAGVPAEMHLFETGPHGTGLALGEPALSMWPEALERWLRGRGLMTPDPVVVAAQKPVVRKPAQPFTVDLTVDELLADSGARAVLMKHWTRQDWDDPQIRRIRPMSLRVVAQYSEFELNGETLAAIERDLAKLPVVR